MDEISVGPMANAIKVVGVTPYISLLLEHLLDSLFSLVMSPVSALHANNKHDVVRVLFVWFRNAKPTENAPRSNRC
jgi:hypothetical protein